MLTQKIALETNERVALAVAHRSFVSSRGDAVKQAANEPKVA
jgi:hypothetical protein